MFFLASKNGYLVMVLPKRHWKSGQKLRELMQKKKWDNRKDVETRLAWNQIDETRNALFESPETVI